MGVGFLGVTASRQPWWHRTRASARRECPAQIRRGEEECTDMWARAVSGRRGRGAWVCGRAELGQHGGNGPRAQKQANQAESEQGRKKTLFYFSNQI